MSTLKNRARIKGFFETGDTPTQSEFSEFIDMIGGEFVDTEPYQQGDVGIWDNSLYRVKAGEAITIGETPGTNPEKYDLLFNYAAYVASLDGYVEGADYQAAVRMADGSVRAVQVTISES